MDYKEKYEQLAKFIKDLYPHMSDYCKEKTEGMIPELKEGEDERIRHYLINFVKINDGVNLSPDDAKKLLAWLEKQGELVNSLSKGLDNAHERIDGLIQKNNSLIEQLEKQGEQTPGDKVELKFKAGDWVVQGKKLYQIEKVTRLPNNHFQYWTTDGVWFGDGTEAHLWTIQDAKEGDVLAVDNGSSICIFDGTVEEGIYPFAYCGLTRYGFEFYDRKLPFTHNTSVYPATKEQRDFLFQRMKEAGYEWDAENKELKKIEHKHICKLDNSYACVKFPFKAKVKSSGTIVTIHNGQLSPDGKEWIKYQSDKEDGYKIYEPDNLELVCEIEQKSLWSEEDEKERKRVVGLLEGWLSTFRDTCYAEDCKRGIAWLESLKKRMEV